MYWYYIVVWRDAGNTRSLVGPFECFHGCLSVVSNCTGIILLCGVTREMF